MEFMGGGRGRSRKSTYEGARESLVVKKNDQIGALSRKGAQELGSSSDKREGLRRK